MKYLIMLMLLLVGCEKNTPSQGEIDSAALNLLVEKEKCEYVGKELGLSAKLYNDNGHTYCLMFHKSGTNFNFELTEIAAIRRYFYIKEGLTR